MITVVLYNLIGTIIAIVEFSHEDVKSVCPNSELWWFALFIGVIWPSFATNCTFNNNREQETSLKITITRTILHIIFNIYNIVWAYDQLWGIPAFANETCAMEHWQQKI